MASFLSFPLNPHIAISSLEAQFWSQAAFVLFNWIGHFEIFTNAKITMDFNDFGRKLSRHAFVPRPGQRQILKVPLAADLITLYWWRTIYICEPIQCMLMDLMEENRKTFNGALKWAEGIARLISTKISMPITLSDWKTYVYRHGCRVHLP